MWSDRFVDSLQSLPGRNPRLEAIFVAACAFPAVLSTWIIFEGLGQSKPMIALTGVCALVVLMILMLGIREPLSLALVVFPLSLIKASENFDLLYGIVIWLLFLLYLGLDRFSEGRLNSREFWILLLVMIAPASGIINAMDTMKGALQYAGPILLPFGLYLAILRHSKGPELIDRIIRVTIWVFAAIGCSSMLMKILDPSIPRLGGPFTLYYTSLGYAAAAILPLCYYRVEHSRHRTLELVLLALVFTGMLLTNTRMALITTFIGAMFFFRRMKFLFLLGGITIAMLLLGEQLDVFGRIQEMSQSDVDISILSRIMGWIAGIKMLGLEPLLGIGYHTYEFEYVQFIKVPIIRLFHAHNLFLNKFLEIGFPAAILFLGYIHYTVISNLFRTARRSSPFGDLRYSLAVACLCYLLAGMTDEVLRQTGWCMWFFMMLGCLRRAELEDRRASIQVHTSHGADRLETGDRRQ